MEQWAYLEGRIQNKYIREGLGAANIEQKMKDNRLRWFRHVQRRGISEPVKKIDSQSLRDLKRERGRPKMTWRTVKKFEGSTLTN